MFSKFIQFQMKTIFLSVENFFFVFKSLILFPVDNFFFLQSVRFYCFVSSVEILFPPSVRTFFKIQYGRKPFTFFEVINFSLNCSTMKIISPLTMCQCIWNWTYVWIKKMRIFNEKINICLYMWNMKRFYFFHFF